MSYKIIRYFRIKLSLNLCCLIKIFYDSTFYHSIHLESLQKSNSVPYLLVNLEKIQEIQNKFESHFRTE